MAVAEATAAAEGTVVAAAITAVVAITVAATTVAGTTAGTTATTIRITTGRISTTRSGAMPAGIRTPAGTAGSDSALDSRGGTRTAITGITALPTVIRTVITGGAMTPRHLS